MGWMDLPYICSYIVTFEKAYYSLFIHSVIICTLYDDDDDDGLKIQRVILYVVIYA